MKKVFVKLLACVLILTLSCGIAFAESYEDAALSFTENINNCLITGGAASEAIYTSYNILEGNIAAFSSADSAISMILYGNDDNQIWGGSIVTSDPQMVRLAMFTVLTAALSAGEAYISDVISISNDLDSCYDELMSGMASGTETAFSFTGSSGFATTLVTLPIENSGSRLTIIWEFPQP